MRQDNILGTLIGLAVGDALGAPYEFLFPPYDVDRNYASGGVHRVSPGEWTDDTSMALCLAQSLIDCNGFDPHDQMKKYISWYSDGYYSTRDKCFDIGITVSRALRLYAVSSAPYCGGTDEYSSGNGSLMRLAPIAMYFHSDHKKLIEYAALSSKTTHASELAIDSCVFFAQLLAGAINGISKEVLLSPTFVDTSEMRAEIVDIANGSYKENKHYDPSGFVVHTLEAALMAFYKYDNFEDGLLSLVSLGNDTDTVGAVYGQIAGAFYGYKGIPSRWRDNLMMHDTIYDVGVQLSTLSPPND